MPSERTELAINGWNSEYIDNLYQQWSDTPTSVSSDWQQFFQGFELGFRPSPDSAPDGVPALPEAGKAAPTARPGKTHIAHTKQGKVDVLIYHYRAVGHLAAELDPL